MEHQKSVEANPLLRSMPEESMMQKKKNEQAYQLLIRIVTISTLYLRSKIQDLIQMEILFQLCLEWL